MQTNNRINKQIIINLHNTRHIIIKFAKNKKKNLEALQKKHITEKKIK